MIKFNNITKTLDGHHYIVDDVSFEVQPGECLVILGSSGSGKTTLLKMVNRLLEPTSGSIEINGQNIAALNLESLRQSIGYVFQGIGLFPHYTVVENIQLVLQLKNADLELAHQFLELVNLDPKRYANRYPAELSGGQQQRVGVARALATQSDILLMDEPFGALDALNRVALQDEVLNLKKKLTKTIVFVTHDIYEALRIADRLAIIHCGKLEQIGTKKDIVQAPATEFVHRLISQASEQIHAFTESLNV